MNSLLVSIYAGLSGKRRFRTEIPDMQSEIGFFYDGRDTLSAMLERIRFLTHISVRAEVQPGDKFPVQQLVFRGGWFKYVKAGTARIDTKRRVRFTAAK